VTITVLNVPQNFTGATLKYYLCPTTVMRRRSPKK